MAGLPALILLSRIGFGFGTWLAPTVVGMGFAALAEEPLNRGLVLRYAELKAGSWWALAVSALVFTALHLPGTPLSIAIHLLGGLALGAGYLLTRRLWLPIGMHAAVNMVAGAASNSGAQTSAPPLPGIVFFSATGVAAILLVLALRRHALVSSSEAWSRQLGQPSHLEEARPIQRLAS